MVVSSARRVALGMVLAVGAFAAPAEAAVIQGVPAQVEYLQTTLMIQHNTLNYVAQTANPGCSIGSTSMDTLKIWASLGQAALLAGKNLTIYFTTCNGTNYIRDLV